MSPCVCCYFHLPFCFTSQSSGPTSILTVLFLTASKTLAHSPFFFYLPLSAYIFCKTDRCNKSIHSSICTLFLLQPLQIHIRCSPSTGRQDVFHSLFIFIPLSSCSLRSHSHTHAHTNVHDISRAKFVSVSVKAGAAMKSSQFVCKETKGKHKSTNARKGMGLKLAKDRCEEVNSSGNWWQSKREDT